MAGRINWGGRLEIGYHARSRPRPVKPAKVLPLFEDAPSIEPDDVEAVAHPSPSAASGPAASPDRALLSSPTRDEEEPRPADQEGVSLEWQIATLVDDIARLSPNSRERPGLVAMLRELRTEQLRRELGRA